MTTIHTVAVAALIVLCVALVVLWLRVRIALAGSRAEVANLRQTAELDESRRREAAIAEDARRREAAEAEKHSREQMQEAFRAEFQMLAARIFEERSTAFKATNKESIDQLLKPFRDNLVDFRKRVEDIYSEENRQHGALKSELNHLLELNRRITEETSNLTSALKGSSKVQGDWGEMILERMLEASNLQRGVHYFVQENFKDEAGANVRPDIVLTLPEGKRVVIDSKVSLTAWVDYTAACSDSDDEAVREGHLRRHVASVRGHIAELHARNYQGTVADSPDFVIMFVPGEPAFMSALQADSSLWAEGYNKRVIISSPTNLFALLRIVDDLWKRDNQSKHALEIARQGGALYDKFVGFVSSLEDVGRGLDRAQKSYVDAFGQLSAGKGNLVGRAERLREMGVKASKKLSSALVDASSDAADSSAENASLDASTESGAADATSESVSADVTNDTLDNPIEN
ncbi:MAG: DNA recombination protein RmuC [Alistipes sp.]|jgi:DNA recombination protein RmuC|nr:DNA recombination protein RmuC [Alistipes sp.]